MIKQFSIAFMTLAGALAVAAPASATTFDYTFTAGSLVATGTLTGNLVAPGEYDITSGTINIVGSSMNGSGVLAPVQSNGNFYTGGGTILTFSPLPDTDLFPNSNPQIDNNGAFTFDLTSGAGAGDGFAIWSNGADNYGGFGGNWNFVGLGGGDSFTTSSVTSEAATPEPDSLLLLGSGLFAMAGGLYRKAKASR